MQKLSLAMDRLSARRGLAHFSAGIRNHLQKR